MFLSSKKSVFAFTLLLFVSPVLLHADTVIQEIVARINGDIITRSDLQRSKEQLQTELKQQFGDQAEAKYKEREKDILRDLIDQQLLLQRGKDEGITGDTELVKKLDEIRKQMNLESMEDLEKAAQQQGVSFEDFKQNIRNGIITQQVIQKEVGSKIQMTPDEEKKFYDEHKSELEHPEQVRLSEILISTEKISKDNPTADAVAVAQQKADELLKSIKGGAAFDEVAKKSSDGPTADQGGDLGYFKRGSLAKGLEDTAFTMKTGDVSDVIRTKQGFIILKVTEHQQAGIPPLKDVEGRVQEAIYLQKLEPALRAYLTKLREEAYIDIRPGYVDTSASPNETKPVFTNAVAQGPASKKKKKKLGVF
ncbi:MAG: peptidylprolyl isomerase [Acidobacteria bacterium]|nr:peptidylprolyl isomerase [Acidobacteriota bacterium]